ncbi:MAG: type II secretion system protein [Cyanobacteria bacterium SIG30]|nr:type II secretion system protein [Cyanobacteria bacterium SIG30]
MNRFNLCVGGGASRSLKAFTLAEVLITLAIIGVVAALTIPSVVTNYKNQETATRLKKTFATLANTTNLAIKDHGPIVGWDLGDTNQSGEQAAEFADKYVVPYLRVIKHCGISTEEGCWYSDDSLPRTLNNTLGLIVANKHPRYILSDGTLVAMFLVKNATSKRIDIYVDVNGFKKPNILGKDIFTFRYSLITNNQPSGKFTMICKKVFEENITNEANGCQLGSDGAYCTCFVQKAGWKIPSRKEYVDMGGNPAKYPW